MSLIVSHNYRLRCFFSSFLPESLREYRFANCAIMKMQLHRTSTRSVSMSIEMVYTGEIPQDARTHYFFTTEEEAPTPSSNRRSFPTYHQLHRHLKTLHISLDQLTIGTNYVFYIVRHGQAEHNTYGKLDILKHLYHADTSLTRVGIYQAKRAGFQLQSILRSHHQQTIHYLFASDLLRTRQTLLHLCGSLKKRQIKLPKQMTVLPCSHEILFTKGNCDQHAWNTINFGAENRSACDVKMSDMDHPCNTMSNSHLRLHVDWSIYLEFYNDSKRPNLHIKNKCTSTNMIAEAIQYTS